MALGFYLGKGKKEDWPDEESDKELKIEPSDDEEEIPVAIVKSKGNVHALFNCIPLKSVFAIYIYLLTFNQWNKFIASV